MLLIPRRSAFRSLANAVGPFLPVAAIAPRIASASQNSGLKFEIYKDGRGGFSWRLKAANGETIANSESYKAKASCRNSIESIKRGAATATIREVP
jgi:uncharacterized protein YegP (UPF0339 family)